MNGILILMDYNTFSVLILGKFQMGKERIPIDWTVLKNAGRGHQFGWSTFQMWKFERQVIGSGELKQGIAQSPTRIDKNIRHFFF
jgi:hypothetical protein